jgi:medium-chain acyl-[acyl-carrier-protein] hydrolase
MTAHLAGRRPARRPAAWLVEAARADNFRPPLVVFPHAGAGTTPYRRLAAECATAFSPVIVRLPGRETRLREPAFRDIGSLVNAALPALLPVLTRSPVLYGHSLGALVAFEVARQARRAYGLEPAHLVVSGCSPARTRTPQRIRHVLPDNELWQSVCELNGMSEEIARDTAMRDLLLPTLRADFEVSETYRYSPGPVLGCPITALAGDRDSEAPASGMTGWAQETTEQFRLHVLPGDHFFNLEAGMRLSAWLPRPEFAAAAA